MGPWQAFLPWEQNDRKDTGNAACLQVIWQLSVATNHKPTKATMPYQSLATL